MKMTILTLYPSMVESVIGTSIVKRARQKGLVEIEIVNIRDFAADSYGTVDDKPYGGGVGMIMKVDVIVRALRSVKVPGHVILTSARGKTYTQKKARELCELKNITIIAGHFEGVDERITNYVNEELSIGEYVLTGGELPAAVMLDSIVRLLPGVLTPGATETESHEMGLLEYPQYTRPSEFEGHSVPEVLRSGNTAKIRQWQKAESEKITHHDNKSK